MFTVDAKSIQPYPTGEHMKKEEKLCGVRGSIMKRNKAALLALLLPILFLGACSSTSEQPEAHSVVSRIIHTTIAVVNADMGVEVDGVRENYSAAIIASLDEDFVLVSPAMAQSGFEGGAYGAVITFPADVSEKVLSFNSRQPERVQLEFKVNQNLTEADYIDTYIKIMNLQVSINTTLAHTYVSSIYAQFHRAQDQMAVVFRNNAENLSVFDIIRLPAFSSGLDFGELPDIPFETAGTDTAPHMVAVADFAENVASVYQTSYNAASERYLDMREGLFELIGGLPGQEENWVGKLTSWSGTVAAHGEELVVFAGDLEEYSGGLQVWLDTAQIWHGDAEDWHAAHKLYFDESLQYLQDMEGYIYLLNSALEPVLDEQTSRLNELDLFLQELQGWHSGMDSVFVQLEEWLEEMKAAQELLEEWRSDLESDKQALQTWHAQILALVNDCACTCTCGCTDCENCEDCADCTDCASCALRLPPDPGIAITQLDLTKFSFPNIPNEFEVPGWSEYFDMPAFAAFGVPTFNELFSESPEGSLPNLTDNMELEPPPQSFDVPQLSTLQPPNPDGEAPPRPDDFWASVNSLHGQLSGFDVGAFLSDDVHQQMSGFFAAYEGFLSMVSSDVDIQFESSLMDLHEVRFGYVEHIMNLRTETLRSEAGEQERLRGDLDEVITLNEGNNEDTHGRLSDFVGMMPESRTYAGVNLDLVDFTVAPFEFISSEARQTLLEGNEAQELSNTSWLRNMIIVIFAAAVFLLSAAATLALLFKKRKMKK